LNLRQKECLRKLKPSTSRGAEDQQSADVNEIEEQILKKNELKNVRQAHSRPNWSSTWKEKSVSARQTIGQGVHGSSDTGNPERAQ
ncbi:hypothetical protein T05_3752, partial [Trichinella murrelli]